MQLRVARAISDQYGKRPASPLDIAVALDMKPTTGPFRYLCGSALAYGITDGGPRSSEIVGSDAFGRYVAQIWSDLREEANRGLQESEDRAKRHGAPA